MVGVLRRRRYRRRVRRLMPTVRGHLGANAQGLGATVFGVVERAEAIARQESIGLADLEPGDITMLAKRAVAEYAALVGDGDGDLPLAQLAHSAAFDSIGLLARPPREQFMRPAADLLEESYDERPLMLFVLALLVEIAAVAIDAAAGPKRMR